MTQASRCFQRALELSNADLSAFHGGVLRAPGGNGQRRHLSSPPAETDVPSILSSLPSLIRLLGTALPEGCTKECVQLRTRG
jgi:hypothetical protein